MTTSAPPHETQITRETAVVFANARGENLIGVWHEAAPAGKAKPTILMLHGWGGYRCGPHQMLTRAARVLARDGYGVLRFDFAGRGDSDGDSELATLATMQEDARAALQWCRDNGFSRNGFVLLGTCAGCEIAVAACGENDVRALIMWGAPVFAAAQSAARDAKKRAHNLRQYAAKLLRAETYRKLFGGRLDVKSIARALRGGGAREDKNREAKSGEEARGQLTPRWREIAVKTFSKRALPLLLIYGTADPVAEEALAWYRANCGTTPQVHFVEGANHAFYGLDWEREVFESTRDWLRISDFSL